MQTERLGQGEGIGGRSTGQKERGRERERVDSHVNSTTIGIELSELAVSDCVSITPKEGGGKGRGSVNDFSANKKVWDSFRGRMSCFF